MTVIDFWIKRMEINNKIIPVFWLGFFIDHCLNMKYKMVPVRKRFTKKYTYK